MQQRTSPFVVQGFLGVLWKARNYIYISMKTCTMMALPQSQTITGWGLRIIITASHRAVLFLHSNYHSITTCNVMPTWQVSMQLFHNGSKHTSNTRNKERTKKKERRLYWTQTQWVTWKNRSDLVLRPNFGLRTNLHRFFKWQQAFGLRPKLWFYLRS